MFMQKTFCQIAGYFRKICIINGGAFYNDHLPMLKMAMVMTHTYAKGQGQRSLSSKVLSQNRRTEVIALSPMLTRNKTKISGECQKITNAAVTQIFSCRQTDDMIIVINSVYYSCC